MTPWTAPALEASARQTFGASFPRAWQILRTALFGRISHPLPVFKAMAILGPSEVLSRLAAFMKTGATSA